MKALIYPLDKVVIDDKNILLEMDKESVFHMLGQGESFDEKRYYFFDSELAIDFDSSDRVEFIEFLGGIEGKLQPTIWEVPVFESQANEVSELFTKKNDGSIEDPDYIEEQMRKANHWATIGIGKKGYYS